MYSSIVAGGVYGIEAQPVRVEVDISGGLPGFIMVGSLSKEVREARERVSVALKNNGWDLPPQKITVNLSPADIRKEGTGFDLAVAVGLLQDLGYFSPERTEDILFAGELGLNGEIKGIPGILPIVEMARRQGFSECIVPWDNREEACVIPQIRVRAGRNMQELLQFLQEADEDRREQLLPVLECRTGELMELGKDRPAVDFADIRGQEAAKRAAEIAAAGFHNLLMSGPPGGGKSMIAKALAGILPDMGWEECMEVSKIYSVAGKLGPERPLVVQRPFQSPHHTIPPAALVGGGIQASPGAISLAHRGVLFLDELPEFPRNILECLRQPIEEKQVDVIRLQTHSVYPAGFMLVSAMNPCKCGFYPDRNRCRCTESEIRRYRNRLSGPFLDRIDIFVETERIGAMELQNLEPGESSKKIRERVQRAIERQKERFCGKTYCFNGDMTAKEIEIFCELGAAQKQIMENAYRQFGMSARSYHRVLKVARTIADLAGEERILEEHLLEALLYRMNF